MFFTWSRSRKHHSAAPVWPSRGLWLEALEDRTLPSTSVPLDPTNWALLGPAPLSPGSQADSGRVTGIAASPTDANTYYLAAASGGVWKTTNAGATWAPLTDGQSTLFMGAIAVAPSDPNTIYAGTGEANLGPSKTNLARDNIFYGRGVLKSTDGGAHWSLLGQAQFDRRTISAVVVDPGNAGTVYVAVGALATNGLAGNTGVWKSTDGGATWTDTTAAISTTAAFSTLVMNPSNSQVLYAGVGTPGGGAANGAYMTLDGGAHWLAAGNFPTGADARVGRVTLAIAPSSPLTLYGAVTSSGQGGSTVGTLYQMLKSTDGGATWSQLSAPDYMGTAGDYDTALAVDPSNANVVYAAGQAGGNSIIESSNGGASWSNIEVGASAPHADHHALAFTVAGKLLDGNDGGIWRLDNANVGSIQWADLNTNLATIQFVGVALHPTNADVAYGGSQDNGTEKFNDSLGWSQVQGGDGGFVRIDPGNPQTVYHTFFYQGPGFLERSDNGGAGWAGKTSGINSADPANFYPPYVLDPSHPSRLLLGTNRVYETNNRADSWAPLSTPFANGWTTNARIDSVAVAPSDVNTVYATAGGRVFVTTNHGATWAERDPVASPSSALEWSDLVVEPANAQTAYAVASNFSDVTGGGHVFRTTNGGASWADVSGNLPDLPTWTIAIVPNGAGPTTDLLYVGNDDGVYVSVDGGTTWARRGAGLPHVQVSDLELNPSLNILAAGTHGRGLWELSTVTADLNWSGGGLSGLPSMTDTATSFTITRTYNVSNLLGNVPVSPNFTISYYASTDTTIGNSDDVFLGEETITAAADKAVGTHGGTSPVLRIRRPGTQYVYAVLDSGNTVPETDKTNNAVLSTTTVTVTGTAPQTPTRYDFGTATSPVAPGYTQVTEGTIYSASQDYGWESSSVDSRDRGTADPLTRDFNFTTDNTFVVDLPAGNYAVTLTLGDALYAQGAMGISLQGTPADVVTTAAGQFVTRSYAVVLGNGQLDLRLVGLGGASPFAVIDALTLTKLPAPLALYDFGTASSPVEPGYTPVTEATTYSAAQGYGWLAGSIQSRDRGTANALTRDFNLTTDGTFAVDLPSATYTVTLTLGDALYAQGAMGISFQGTQVDAITTAGGQFAIRTYAVTVNNGQLDLRLVGLGPTSPFAVIDGLTITPPTAGPRVVSATPQGNVTGPVGAVTLNFSAAIKDGTFTLASVDSLTGPGGAITPTAVNKVSSTQYQVTFPAQSAPGNYTLVVGPHVQDAFGNEMDQNQNGVNGEDPADRFTTAFTIVTTMPVPTQFDFGTATSPVAPGYTQVTEATRYSVGQGYGWLAGAIDSRDRGTADPLTRDFNFTTDGTFAVDVANGNYNVTVTQGDALYAQGAMGNYLQGNQVDAVTTAAGQFVTHTYTATVSGGQLDLRLVGLGGASPFAVIDALTITAAKPALARYDFGTATSPVAPGYTQVTEATAYSAAQGYGWLAGTIQSRDRGTADPLTRDFNFTTDGTFAVDLANGAYNVTLTTGDASYAQGAMGFYLQGNQVDSVSTAANQFVARTYTVTVSNGQLDLRLVGLGPTSPFALIDALSIAPA